MKDAEDEAFEAIEKAQGWRKRQITEVDSQCPSCGGFCKRSGCERADYVPPKRAWVGLTDDEIREYLLQPVERDLLSFTRFIEAKLKEKNT